MTVWSAWGEQNGQQVVNEALQLQGKGGRGKGGNQHAVNQKAAAPNRATPSRPFAVQQKTSTPQPKTAAVQKVVKHDKWAGGAFLNSPAPSALPMPSIGLPAASEAANPAFLDPAILTSSTQMGAGSSAQPATLPGVPPVLLPAGTRVHAQFLDGEWYDGTIHGNTPTGHMILFDGLPHPLPHPLPRPVPRPLPPSLSPPSPSFSPSPRSFSRL